MAFIDVDEFIVMRDANFTSLPQLLRQYTDYGALAVNWQVNANHLPMPGAQLFAMSVRILVWQQVVANTEFRSVHVCLPVSASDISHHGHADLWSIWACADATGQHAELLHSMLPRA